MPAATPISKATDWLTTTLQWAATAIQAAMGETHRNQQVLNCDGRYDEVAAKWALKDETPQSTVRVNRSCIVQRDTSSAAIVQSDTSIAALLPLWLRHFVPSDSLRLSGSLTFSLYCEMGLWYLSADIWKQNIKAADVGEITEVKITGDNQSTDSWTPSFIKVTLFVSPPLVLAPIVNYHVLRYTRKGAVYIAHYLIYNTLLSHELTCPNLDI